MHPQIVNMRPSISAAVDPPQLIAQVHKHFVHLPQAQGLANTLASGAYKEPCRVSHFDMAIAQSAIAFQRLNRA
jgi:hypothetical protein